MSPYLPQTENDLRIMLETIGVSSVEELFEDVPAQHRFPKLNLPGAVSE